LITDYISKKPVGKDDASTTIRTAENDVKDKDEAANIPASELHVPQPPSNSRRRPALPLGGDERTLTKKDNKQHDIE